MYLFQFLSRSNISILCLGSNISRSVERSMSRARESGAPWFKKNDESHRKL